MKKREQPLRGKRFDESVGSETSKAGRYFQKVYKAVEDLSTAVNLIYNGFPLMIDRIKRLGRLLWERKLWWLIPIILCASALALILLLTQGSSVNHLIYFLF